MHATSHRLLEALGPDAASATSVLELGCGSGALLTSLLERGVPSATGVDLSPESLALARRRAAAAGVETRADLRVGNGATVTVEPHDWVVLDRVLCCYRDLDLLLANSTAAARRRYAFSVPISAGWRGVLNRLIVGAEGAVARFRRDKCPAFVHDVGTIEARVTNAGFRRTRTTAEGAWYVAVFDRA
jgi:magnesium-protoporphyrin O-methyltransferase